MNSYVDRLFTNIYTFLITIFNRLIFSNIRNKKMIIIADGLIGDTVLIIDFLKECSNFFGNKNGYEIDIFFSKKFVADFYKECCAIDGINVIEAHFNNKENSFRDLKSVLRTLHQKRYEILINPHPKHKGDRVSGCIKAGKKIAVRDDLHNHEKIFNYWFRKCVYTDITEVEKFVMEFERYKEALRISGDLDYNSSIPYIKKTKKDNKKLYSDYYVIAAGSSEEGKKYELEKYAAVIDYIWSKNSLPVVFVGSAADAKDVNELISLLDKNIEYCNLTGTTTFSQWVEVIRDAKFLIGNDSASVHIAAAVETHSICIVGEWQYKRFYPYILDNESEYKPIMINCGVEMDCRNCNRDIRKMQDKECAEAAKNNEPLKCIKMVSTKSIVRALETLM